MQSIEWKISNELVPYEEATAEMESRVADIRAGLKPEMIWLLEHPPLYTAGTSAKVGDLLSSDFPVYQTGRGGQYTYHGPGQRVAYVMLDLKARQQVPDIKQYVCNLEQWIIDSLQEFEIKGERREGRVGIWVDRGFSPHPNPLPAGERENERREWGEGSLPREVKIAAIGVRIRHWVTYHGIAINLNPDLSHYSGIVPCGINDAGVTSFEDLGARTSMAELDQALKQEFGKVFDKNG